MISKEQIEQVKDRASIVEVIGEYVPLTKKGANHLGLCPFHGEKTPSFTVSESKQLFYCFGCHESGTVITFLMKHANMAFPEAVKTLAARYGIKIEETGGGRESSHKNDPLYKANLLALDYFVSSLESPGGSKAREYLEKRGLSQEIIEKFKIGYAPDSWDGISNHLSKNNITAEYGEKAGLLSRKDVRTYDRFRGRVMFPITDTRGRVVAYGGRSLDNGDSNGAKYLNSSETDIFKKGDTLYGYYQARQAIGQKGYSLVVEGYMDHLALFKNGFENVVATMGTALTADHIRRLKSLGGDIYTLFDGDNAGVKAAVRTLPMFLEVGLSAKAVVMPKGMDPDDYLKEFGAEGMEKVIKNAPSLMDFCLENLKTNYDMKSGEGKGKYMDAALEYLRKIKKVAERNHYASKVSTTVGVELTDIQSLIQTDGDIKSTPSRIKGKLAGVSKNKTAQSTILKVLIKKPELYTADMADVLDTFRDGVFSKTASALERFFSVGGTDSSALLEETSDNEVRAFLGSVLIEGDEGFFENPEQMLNDCIDRIRSSGEFKAATIEHIEKLKSSGRGDLAKEIEARLKRK